MNKSLTATLKYALISEQKLALIAKLARGKRVKDVLDTLQLLPNKGAKVLYKVIKSAASNATTNESKDLDKLYVQTIDITRGPKIKRMRFASRSRIAHYVKYRSFVRVVLNVK